MPDLLPDCRATITKGRVFTFGGVLVPVFCANCGRDGGWCPEENMTFLFYLCPHCAETYGAVAGTMLMPDEVFFSKLAEAQIEEVGHALSPEEWRRLDDSHTLVKLANSR